MPIQHNLQWFIFCSFSKDRLEIFAKSETTRSRDGSSVRLFCQVARISGSIKYYWKRDGHALDPEEDRYRMFHSLYNTTLVIMPVNGHFNISNTPIFLLKNVKSFCIAKASLIFSIKTLVYLVIKF